MDTQRLIDRFRSEVFDTVEPFLWSDEDVVSYLDEAQKWLCRKGAGIADSTSKITRVPMSANNPWSAIDPRILKIRFAKRESDNREIHIINFEDVQYRPTILHTTYSGLPTYLDFNDAQTGDVSALVEGMEASKVRWMYVPAVADAARLIVYRMPLADITLDDGELADLEVDEQHHIPLLDGMKAYAYKKEDAETFDKAKQEKHEALFAAYCDQARLERERREHKPRTVRYGGIYF